MDVNVFESTNIAVEDIDITNELTQENVIIKEDVEVSNFSSNRTGTYIGKVVKRIVDIFAGIVGALILIPLTAVIYIINKVNHEDGPIFFVQERLGKDGKTFKMLKYRSMVVGAEDKLKEYLSENEEAALEYKEYKKLKDDPRVTKVGKILRKTSLDEMPQLLHLISGKMSLVGPRPYLPGEKEDMGEYYNIIIKDKPGITGLWQVNGRSDVTFQDRLNMDSQYYKEKSLKKDFVILYQTFKHVIKREGAV